MSPSSLPSPHPSYVVVGRDPDCGGCLSRAGSAFARQAAPRSGPRPTSQTSSNKAGSSIRRHPTQTALYRPRATRLMPRAARSRRGKPHPGPRATSASAAGEYVHSRIAPPTPARVAPLKSPQHGQFCPYSSQLNRMPIIGHCRKRSFFSLSTDPCRRDCRYRLKITTPHQRFYQAYPMRADWIAAQIEEM